MIFAFYKVNDILAKLFKFIMMLRKEITLETAIDICKRYLNYLPSELGVERAYIFGSYAKA